MSAVNDSLAMQTCSISIVTRHIKITKLQKLNTQNCVQFNDVYKAISLKQQKWSFMIVRYYESYVQAYIFISND